MKLQYYLIETHKSNEGSVLFWKEKAQGYTSDIDQAGLFNYDFVKKYYLGEANDTVAIEKEKFEATMKTSKIVWNFSDIYNLINDVRENHIKSITKEEQWKLKKKKK